MAHTAPIPGDSRSGIAERLAVALCQPVRMDEVRREDGELCGFVVATGDGWDATTVFGAVLETVADRDDAARIVREHGLASLAERWLLIGGPGGDEQIVCIQEASPAGVTLALDYYSMPGVPTLRITRDELAAGHVTLRRR